MQSCLVYLHQLIQFLEIDTLQYMRPFGLCKSCCLFTNIQFIYSSRQAAEFFALFKLQDHLQSVVVCGCFQYCFDSLVVDTPLMVDLSVKLELGSSTAFLDGWLACVH